MRAKAPKASDEPHLLCCLALAHLQQLTLLLPGVIRLHGHQTARLVVVGCGLQHIVRAVLLLSCNRAADVRQTLFALHSIGSRMFLSHLSPMVHLYL